MPNVVVTTYPPTWNMQQLQFANIQLALEGTPFAFFQEIEYSTSISVEEGRGVSPYPMGTTTGSASFSASISVQLAMREPFMKIISALSPDGNSWGDALFNVQVTWQTKVGPNQLQPPVMIDELFGCRLTSSGISGSSGPGVMVCRYSMSVQLIRENGRLPLAGMPV